MRSRLNVTSVTTVATISSSEDERIGSSRESEFNSGSEEYVAQASPVSTTPCTSRM